MGVNVIESSLLLHAYSQGIFPMAMENGEIGWFSPDPRGVIPLNTFHVPHGVKRSLKKCSFEVRFSTQFREVMLGCADRDETWIDATVLESYCVLHELGFAHSVETWSEGELVGGLYGVTLGGAFFGESMFSRVSNGSSAALVALVGHLRERGYSLLDTQWTTPHLERFGAIEIPRERYLRELKKALAMPTRFFDDRQP